MSDEKETAAVTVYSYLNKEERNKKSHSTTLWLFLIVCKQLLIVQCLGTTNDLKDFVCNGSLTCLVISQFKLIA